MLIKKTGSWILAIVTLGGATHLALTQTEATRQMVEEDKDWSSASSSAKLSSY